MSKAIDYVPASAPRRAGIRFRVVVVAGLIAAALIAMGYVTGSPGTKDPSYPNLVWFYFAFWPGAVAVGTAFLSFLFTGRPW